MEKANSHDEIQTEARLASLVIVAVILIASLQIAFVSRSAFAAIPFTASFDFDNGEPALPLYRGTPLNQTFSNVTAYFSSSSDPAAFSVQADTTTSYKLSNFSGKYLWDSKPSRDFLDIRFSVPVNNISFVFATLEFHGGPTAEPSNVTLTAYMNSTATIPIGSTMARGTWPSSGDSYPQGNLTFAASQQFDLVRIELPYQGVSAAIDFLVDNVTVAGTSDVIPEFPNAAILPISMLVATLALFIANKKKKHPK